MLSSLKLHKNLIHIFENFVSILNIFDSFQGMLHHTLGEEMKGGKMFWKKNSKLSSPKYQLLNSTMVFQNKKKPHDLPDVDIVVC